MRFSELNEGVKLGSTERQAAYMVAVAEAYDAAPAHDPAATDLGQGLADHTRDVLFRRLEGSGIDVQFVENDPYEIGSPEDSVKYLLYDIVKNKRMMVYTGFSDNHPVFSFDDNVMFRAVHDFFAHASVRKAFTQSMTEAGGARSVHRNHRTGLLPSHLRIVPRTEGGGAARFRLQEHRARQAGEPRRQAHQPSAGDHPVGRDDYRVEYSRQASDRNESPSTGRRRTSLTDYTTGVIFVVWKK